jgi:erythromycin esterase
LAVLVLVAGARGARAQTSAPIPARPPVGFPILHGVWRVDGTDPALPDADLQPLRGILGKATVVGLGESIHTSGGYYEAKHRLFRFLVERLGFRAIAFETPWLAGDTANRYVQTCEGDPDTASAGFFGVWRSRELSALLGWMCEWNRAHPKPKDRVAVFAFDVQYQAAQDAEALVAFLRRVGIDPELAPFDGLARCGAVEAAFRGTQVVPPEETAACNGAARAVADRFAHDAAALIRQVGKTDFTWATLRLTGLQAWIEEMVYFDSDFERSFAARDRGMAALFLGIRALRMPGAKVAVWAHDAHIAKDGSGFGLVVMGSVLAGALGPRYATLGLVGHDVSIDWRGVGCGPVPPPGAASVEELLHDLGEEALLVDLRFPGAAPPLLTPGATYEIVHASMVPLRAFNGLLYLEHSRAMAPLAWPPCQ